MAEGKESIRRRRESLLNSLEDSGSGGFTKFAAERMAAPMNGQPAQCIVTKYCRTSIFEYPGTHLIQAVEPHIVYSQDAIKVAIVSNLTAYFEQSSTPSLHYSIDVSLRAGVHSTYKETIERANRQTSHEAPLFLVIEECADVPPTDLDDGVAFTFDECVDGQATIEGGRDGERALLAVKTINGCWPDFRPDTHDINVVLTAVKAQQDVTRHIEKLYSCSCFVSNEGQAIYTLIPKISAPSLQTATRLEASQVQGKANDLASMLDAMMSDSEPAAAELFDSVILDKNNDDIYLRLWYLRLWQAVEDAGRYLGCRQPCNTTTIIAGNRTPKELYEYRNIIAHWHTGRIDFSYLRDLQHTTMELLRRKYRRSKNDPPG